MANELKGTMTQASQIGTNVNPSNVGNFQAVLRQISRDTYEKRAKSDEKSSALAGAGVKPSEVSGGTFASVMGALEQMRGGDISKEFAAGVQGYKDVLDAREKQRAEARANANSAMENMARASKLIDDALARGDIPPDSYYIAAGIDPKTRNSVSISEDLIPFASALANVTSGDGKIPIDKYKDAKNEYLKQKNAFVLAPEASKVLEQKFDDTFGRYLLEDDAKSLGIKVMDTDINVNTPEYQNAKAIFNGTGRLSDISEKGNLRAKTGQVLEKLKRDALASGDMTGIMRASAGGKDVDQNFLTSFEKGVSVLTQLDSLAKTIDEEATGPILGIIRSWNPYDTKAQLIKAQLTSIVPNLARGVYGEVGVLTDNDVALYSKTLPNLTSKEDLRNAILVMTLKTVQNSLKNKIKTQASGNRDVSGYVDQYNELTSKVNELESSFDKTIQPNQVTDSKEWLKTVKSPELMDFLKNKNL